MTSYSEMDGMGLFTGFLKGLWAIVSAATAAFFILIGILRPDPYGSVWILMGLFILALVLITVWMIGRWL